MAYLTDFIFFCESLKMRMNLRLLLLPFSILYGSVTKVRNMLFDNGNITSKAYKTPVIVIGNLSTGGTGKTPHTEYLVKLLSPLKSIAVLSRGYGRKSKGFLLSDEASTAIEIGDEPKQIKRKFPHVPVAVCEKRVIGIDQLLSTIVGLETILLDDAYQHRYVKPGLAILISSFHDLFYKDYILPAGNLRESRNGAERADIVIVSKCPFSLNEKETKSIESKIRRYSKAPVFFTRFNYQNIVAPNGEEYKIEVLNSSIVLCTGIANPKPLVDFLAQNNIEIKSHLHYGDHHNFTEDDYSTIAKEAEYNNCPILFTEKDFVRIPSENLKQLTSKSKVYYIPIEVVFINEQGSKFDQIILDYVK